MNDKLALHLLCKIFQSKGAQDTFIYIYEENEVWHILVSVV